MDEFCLEVSNYFYVDTFVGFVKDFNSKALKKYLATSFWIQIWSHCVTKVDSAQAKIGQKNLPEILFDHFMDLLNSSQQSNFTNTNSNTVS